MRTGILFDLDGTLLDTLEDLLEATNHALRTCGYPERRLEELRRFVGNGAQNQIRMALPAQTPEEQVRRVLEVYKPYYTAHCQQKTRPYPGITEALAALGERYPLAIVSNKPDGAVKALCGKHFPGVFALGETQGCPRKPAADMVYRAMAAIGVDRCVYVGDSEVDILTANNAGVPVVSVLWGFRDRCELTAAGAEHFCEAPQMLDKCIARILSEGASSRPDQGQNFS